jgi:hypothetical protein
MNAPVVNRQPAYGVGVTEGAAGDGDEVGGVGAVGTGVGTGIQEGVKVQAAVGVGVGVGVGERYGTGVYVGIEWG